VIKLKKFLPVVLVIVFIAAVSIFMIKSLTTDVDLSISTAAQALHIKHKGGTLLPKEDFTISFADVTKVEILEALPSMRKVNGLDNTSVRIGAFSTQELGEFRAYINLKQKKHLVIYTAQSTYIVTPVDAEAVYQAIQNR